MTADGRIRIIAGQWRNSRLEVPSAPGLRPTPERVRETLFNWLAPVLPGMRVLDLCAGTGALGMEACSRGAREAVFVEPEPGVAQALAVNLQRLKAPGQLVRCTAQAYLQGVAQPFDLILLDPPFAQDLWAELARQLEQGGWLAPRAWIYVESPKGLAPQLPPAWQMHREGAAGEVRYALYRRLPDLQLS